MSYCEEILQKAKGLRLDECEVLSIKKRIITIRITDSEIAELKQNEDRSIAARIIHEKKIMSAKFSPSQREHSLEAILQTKANVQSKDFWKSLPLPSKLPKIEKTYDSRLEGMTGTIAAEIATEMINSATHSNITRISGSLNIVSEHFQIMNTNGLDYSDNSTYIGGTINSEAEIDNSPVSGIGAVSSRTLDNFSAKEIGNDAKEMCLNSRNPKKIEQDSYSIIFEPYAFGELLTFVFAPNFNLKTYYEKRSCFAGIMGNKIANDNFSLVDDPHYPEGVGSKPFDDEGTPTSPQSLIDSGTFTHVFSDSFDAAKEGTNTSGNGARPGSPMGRSTQPVPVPMPHNLRVIEGNMAKYEIESETRKGLLVGRLWYTYPVNAERGDFSCTARSGIRVIEGGKIVGTGKPVRIVHNLRLLLNNISAVGNDSKNVLQWSALPAITPSIRVDSVRITTI